MSVEPEKSEFDICSKCGKNVYKHEDGAEDIECRDCTRKAYLADQLKMTTNPGLKVCDECKVEFRECKGAHNCLNCNRWYCKGHPEYCNFPPYLPKQYSSLGNIVEPFCEMCEWASAWEYARV